MSARRPPLARVRILLAGVAVAVVALVASAAGTAATVSTAAKGAPPATARDLAQLYFANPLVRAEVVSLVGRVEHDYRVDVGRVVAVRASSVDLLEKDGTRQTIAIGPQTLIAGVGRLFAPGTIARGTRVVTLRDGSGPAQQVRPASWARVLGKSLFGGTLVRAEVLNYQAKTLHDYRIDEGRIVAVKPASITLAERDGSRQAIPTAASTLVTVGGQAVDPSVVVKGMTALTVREGDGPAEQIMLSAFGVGR
jgi:hypothetical protein